MVDLNQNEKMSYLFTAEKAGMQGLNREEINKIITEATKNSRMSKKNQEDLDAKLQQESLAIQKLEKNQDEMMIAMEKLSNKIDALIDSDKDDIKSFLVKEHHYFCYQRGWVDDYSLDCCEKRYKHYVQEGGNSFIEDMMNEIRNLPKQPPQT